MLFKISKSIFTFILISISLITSCEDPVSSPPEFSLQTLLSSPDTVEIGNQRIFLSTYLWRDFMPVSPPNGKPLIASVNIESVDSSDISDLLEPKAIYIINGNQVWNSYFTDESFAYDPPYRITRIARDGPKWGPELWLTL
jgi:hypothetical protein